MSYGGYSKEEYKRAERESFYAAAACVAAFVALMAFVALIV